MKYDFDAVYDRKNSNLIKYSPHPRYPDTENFIPMWIADMDFKTAPEIIDALKGAAEEGIFGYTGVDKEYFDLFIDWYKKRFGVNLSREWIIPCDGVMFAVSAAIRALSNTGDAVLVFQPVYYPFSNVISDNNRRLAVSELVLDGAEYKIDYEDLERKILENQVKILLFCSPHNPVGRVWKSEEIKRVAEICKKHGVFIICDEIHSDLVFEKHYPAFSVSKEIADITVEVTSVTKTFNLAGIKGANLIIPNGEISSKINNELKSVYSGGLSIMSLTAIKAAYKYGAQWLDELLIYLQGNIDYVIRSFESTKIKPTVPQGTYLMWLDCRKLGLSDDKLEEFFIRKCGVRMNGGYIFGKGGSGFVRMNIACPRATLEKAIKQISENVD